MDLLVQLGDVPIGVIRTSTDGRNEFSLLSEYLAMSRRPVLGQYFEDHLTDIHRSRVNLPPFFSNLLPEGGLRELLARKAAIVPEKEAELIALLGEDLPGGVVVRKISASGDEPADVPVMSDVEEPAGEPVLRFSLAGAQLKFSVLYREGGRGPTLPIDGRGGNWIAKLPSETFEEVPENEHAMIGWARRVGIAVSETMLVKAGEVAGLPVAIDPNKYVFLSKRFDRPAPNVRVHQEDFAQVMNVRHSMRYGQLSHASIARIVRAIAGEEDFDEVIRRTAFNIIIGNGDAHLKNWSLIYPDGVQARLSPAYDLVATISYIPGDKLALKLSRESRFDRIEYAHFRRLAEKAGVDGDRVVRVVRETVEKAMATWPDDLTGQKAKILREHTERLPIVMTEP